MSSCPADRFFSGRTDADAPLRRRVVPTELFKRFVFAEHIACGFEQLRTECRQPQRLARAIEHGPAVMRFDGVDLERQGRLRIPERLRRLRIAAQLGNLHQCPQISYLYHFASPFYSSLLLYHKNIFSMGFNERFFTTTPCSGVTPHRIVICVHFASVIVFIISSIFLKSIFYNFNFTNTSFCIMIKSMKDFS